MAYVSLVVWMIIILAGLFSPRSLTLKIDDKEVRINNPFLRVLALLCIVVLVSLLFLAMGYIGEFILSPFKLLFS